VIKILVNEEALAHWRLLLQKEEKVLFKCFGGKEVSA